MGCGLRGAGFLLFLDIRMIMTIMAITAAAISPISHIGKAFASCRSATAVLSLDAASSTAVCVAVSSASTFLAFSRALVRSCADSFVYFVRSIPAAWEIAEESWDLSTDEAITSSLLVVLL